LVDKFGSDDGAKINGMVCDFRKDTENMEVFEFALNTNGSHDLGMCFAWLEGKW
jgi:hypothetical protein